MPISTIRPLVITGGWSISSGSVGATLTVIKPGAGQLGGWFIYNSNAVVAYCQFFDSSGSGIVLGTSIPVMSFGIPSAAGANIPPAGNMGIQFNSGIIIAFTTTRTGSTANANTVDYNFWFK